MQLLADTREPTRRNLTLISGSCELRYLHLIFFIFLGNFPDLVSDPPPVHAREAGNARFSPSFTLGLPKRGRPDEGSKRHGIEGTRAMAENGWRVDERERQSADGRDALCLPVTVRPARAADLPLLEWHGQHTPHREIIANAFRMQENGTGVLLLTEVNGFPAGQICVDFLRKRHLGRATLWALRVFPPFRGTGLGTRLMRAAEAVVAGRGGGIAELGVDRDNAGVLPFYDRLGYRACGTERGHFAYRPPDGPLVRVAIDQWLLHKRIAPAAQPASRDRQMERMAAE